MIRATLLTLVLGACGANVWAGGATATSVEKPLQAALEKYLATQGRLCLGKFDWPIDVPADEFPAATRDAIQLPALQKLGLVTSSDTTVQRASDDGKVIVPAKRFELTAAGRKFYFAREAVTRSSDGRMIEHHKDFCAAKLSLDRVVRWEETSAGDGIREGTLHYTYRVTPAEWARSHDVLTVFPMVDKIIQGEGKLELEQRMRLGKKGWFAVICAQ